MLYLGSWSGTSTYSNKWSIYQESTTEKNYFGSAVLIGTTTNSGYKLDVSGTGRFTTTLNVGTTAYVTNDIFIGDTTSGSGRFFITDSSNQGITLRRAGAADRFKLFVGNGTTYTQDNAIILGTNTDIDFYTGSSPIKRLTILNGGGLMIPSDVSGTSGYKINYTSADAGSRSWKIANDNSAYGDFYIGQSTTQSGSSYATKFLITPAGDVAINDTTANTYAKLQVTATSGVVLGLANPSAAAAGVGNAIQFWGTSGYNTQGEIATVWDGASNGYAYMTFKTKGPSLLERMRITSGGNVLIGTTSDYGNSNLLQVSSGNIRHYQNNESCQLAHAGSMTIANGGTKTLECANGGLVFVSENNTGDGALFFCGYKSATIILIADPNNRYAATNTAGRACLYKSANTNVVTFINNLGSSLSFTMYQIKNSD
jgi:hypothetical protein